MALARLVYISEPMLDPAKGSTVSQLVSIMASSKRRNRAANITGALAYDDAWFLQVLEGDRNAIWQTFRRIDEDGRHDNCLLIEMVEVEQRLFGNWWMGLATRDAVTAPVFQPYLRGGTLQADTMTGHQILSLMTALATLGLDRQVRAAA